MRIALRLGRSSILGLSGWPALLPGLLPQHEWIEAPGVAVDLVIAPMSSEDDPLPGEADPAGPALWLVPDVQAYRAWQRHQEQPAGPRAWGFLCFSQAMAGIVAAEQVAPVDALPWHAGLLAEGLLDAGPLDADPVGANRAALSSEVTSAVMVPLGDGPSAARLAGWLQARDPSGSQIAVIGPMSADAGYVLQPAMDEGRAVVIAARSDDAALAALAGMESAIVIDPRSEVDLPATLGPLAATGRRVARVPAGSDAPTTWDALDAWAGGGGPVLARIDVSKAMREVAQALGQSIRRAVGHGPVAEAMHAMGVSLGERGLSSAPTRATAAASFAWMLDQQ